jgi:hydrogenase maturation protease
MNPPKQILIAGIGNIFFGDDAFGCEVAQRLWRSQWPDGIQVRDFGIRGIDLAYALMEPFDHVILIDAVPRGGAPGTLYVIEPNVPDPSVHAPETQSLWDAHTMDPVKVLRLAQSMGAKIDHVLIVGCEPSPLDSDDEMQSALTAPVEQAIAQVAELVKSIVTQLQSGEILKFEQSIQLPPLQLAAARSEMQSEETAT